MPLTRTRARVGYLGLAAVDSYLAGRKGKAARRARLVTKPLLMPALATVTHLGAGARTDGLLCGTQAAQLFSWRGDVALLGTSKASFLGGVAAFFAAHVAYIGAFTSARDEHAGLSFPGPKVAAAVWTAGTPVVAMAVRRKDPAMVVPVAAYAAVLSTMFATSTTLRRSAPPAARRKVVAGTTLFLLSDSLLAVQEFFLDHRSPTLESAVMATYTTGQLLIAEGVLDARR